MEFLPHKRLMQRDEIFTLAEKFVDLGVTKIRLTGGEPLARKDFANIVSDLSRLRIELTLTTNAFLLHKHFDTLQESGIRSVNISLDTLQPDRFKKITRRDAYNKVWENINTAIQRGFRVKLNVVLLKDVNDDEVDDFVKLTENLPIHVRFIEFMPFHKNEWQAEKVIDHSEIIANLNASYPLFKLKDGKHDTDRKFGVLGHDGTVSFISTLSHPFCDHCNRLRLTADGKLKNCLFGAEEFDLLSPLRQGEDVESIIRLGVSKKYAQLGGQFTDYKSLHAEDLTNRSMIQIGG